VDGLANQPWFLPVLGAAHLLVGALVAPELGARLRRGRGAAAMVALLAMAVGWALGQGMPAGWVTSLREGFTRDHLRFVAGLGTHAGPLLQGFWVPALGLGGLRDLVSFNLACTGLDLVLLSTLLGRSAGAAALLPLVWLVRPMGLSTALSETEAPLSTALLLTAAHVALGVPDRARRTGALLTLAAILATCRIELALLPALAAVARLHDRWRVEDRWARLVDRLAVHPLAAPAAAALVAAWMTVGERLVRWTPVDGVRGDLRWALDAADPLNTRVALLLPLAVSALSPGVVLLAVVGMAMAARRPLRHGLVLPGLLLVFGAWYLAAHGATHGSVHPPSSWELLRYLELASALLMLLAGRGLMALPRRARPALLAACLIPPVPAAMDLLEPAFGPAGRPPALTLVDQDPQREVRLLLAFTEAHPDCAVLTRALPWSGQDRGGALQWTALVPWRGGWRVRDDWRWEGGAVRGEQVPACVVGLRPLDCAVVGREPCGWLEGREALVEERWEHRPYVHPDHGATWRGEVGVGIYGLVGGR
jgi:hypothetical protein